MLKTVVICFLLSINTFSVLGQIPSIDNLKIKANKETDISKKIQYYIDISNDYIQKQVHYDSALIYLDKIKSIASGENQKEIIHVINNQAIIHHTLGDKEKAISHFNEGLLFSKKMNTPYQVALQYNNLGMIHKEEGNYEKALTYLDSSLTILKPNTYKWLYGVVHTSIGETQYELGNYKEASYYLKKGVQRLDSLGKPESEADIILAKSYSAEKKIDAAIIQAKKAFRQAEQRKAPKSAYESSMLLSSIFSEMKDYENEIFYLNKALSYNEILSKSTDLEEIELYKLKEQYKVQEEQLNSLKNKNLIYPILYIVGGSVILILLSLLIYRQFRVSKLTRDIHATQKNLIQSELDRRGKRV